MPERWKLLVYNNYVFFYSYVYLKEGVGGWVVVVGWVGGGVEGGGCRSGHIVSRS